MRYLRVQHSFANTSNRSLTVALVGHSEVGVRILTSGGCGTTPDDITANYRQGVGEEEELPRSARSKQPSHFPPPTRDCSFEVVTSDEASLGEQLMSSSGHGNSCGVLSTASLIVNSSVVAICSI